MNITRCLTISITHVTKDTILKLEDASEHPINSLNVPIYKYGIRGYWIWCGHNMINNHNGGKNIPEDLWDCMLLAYENDCKWLCLECCIDNIKDLPVYNWHDSKEESKQFTWTDKEDDELYKNGATIMWVSGRSKAIQKFVEALSYKIGYKCDFAYTAGRAHIDVPKEAYSKCIELFDNGEFIKPFIVPYSEETYNNETYFEVL